MRRIGGQYSRIELNSTDRGPLSGKDQGPRVRRIVILAKNRPETTRDDAIPDRRRVSSRLRATFRHAGARPPGVSRPASRASVGVAGHCSQRSEQR
jgi:hypothetical protein